MGRTYLFRQSKSRGFTLIELMYACGFFMIGLTGLIFFQVSAIQGAVQAEHLSRATTLATNLTELMRSLPLQTLGALPQQSVVSYDLNGVAQGRPGYQAPFYTLTNVVVQPSGSNTFLSASVTVNWQNSPNPFVHGVNVQTYILMQ